MNPVNNEHKMDVNRKEEQDKEQMTTMMIPAESVYVWVHNRSNMPMFCLKKLISQPWVVQESPSLAQMTFTQCASMSDLKFDSVAPPGGQIHQYVSFSVLFQSPTKDMAQKYGSTVKNLILGFSPKLSGGVLIYVWKPGKNFGPKSQC